MKADLTRSTFDPLNNFSRVLMQQGRVQLDADWNEQTDILLYTLRRFIADAFPSGHGTGFALAALATTPAVADDFSIAGGSYYAGGILIELDTSPVPVLRWEDETHVVVARWTADGVAFAPDQYVQFVNLRAVQPQIPTRKIVAVDYSKMLLTLDAPIRYFQNAAVRRLVTYKSQPFLPDAPALAPTHKNGNSSSYQLYLDVWERVVTYLQDDAIREVALNGPDTAVRTQVVWQVKATPYIPPGTGTSSGGSSEGYTATQDQGTPYYTESRYCMTPEALTELFQPANVGLMRARSQPAQISTDPCTIAPDSTYRGENQLYRVEIHTGGFPGAGGAEPSFKWSRENGSVVYPIVSLAAGGGTPATTTVTLGNLGRDDRFGLVKDDYVEIVDDRSELTNTAGPLLRVQSIDAGSQLVTLQGSTTMTLDAARHPLLRRWDHRAGDPAAGGEKIATDGALPIQPDRWIDLEDGIQVQFPKIDGAAYRGGDYWLIPARVATGDIVWPRESGPDSQRKIITQPLAKPPDGVVHHYVPLAVFTGDANTPTITPCGRAAGIQPVYSRDVMQPAEQFSQASAAQAPQAAQAKVAEVAQAAEVAQPMQIEKAPPVAQTAQVAKAVEVAKAADVAQPAQVAKATQVAKAVEVAPAADVAQSVKLAEAVKPATRTVTAKDVATEAAQPEPPPPA